MTESKKQPIYYVVFFDIDYPSVAEAIAEAPEAIAAHKKRSQEWHEQGNHNREYAITEGFDPIFVHWRAPALQLPP